MATQNHNPYFDGKFKVDVNQVQHYSDIGIQDVAAPATILQAAKAREDEAKAAAEKSQREFIDNLGGGSALD